MSAQTNVQLIKSHFEAANAHDPARVAETINTPDARWTNVPAGASFRGPEGYKQFLGVFLNAMPDAKVEIKNISAGEDWAVAEFNGRGTQTGPFRMPAGDIPPTGKKIDVPFCEVYAIRGGKIASCNLYFDTATMMRQLGLVT